MVACLLAILGGSACSEASGDVPPSDLPENLDLTGATAIERVSIGGWGSTERAVPESLDTEVGAVVVFQVADWRLHTVRFLTDEMDAGQVAYLEGLGQVESPPLVTRGSRFLVTFEGAPPGAYPYSLEGFGNPARGVIRVGPGS